MASVCQNIALSLRILNQILAENLLLVKNFHGKELAGLLGLS